MLRNLATRLSTNRPSGQSVFADRVRQGNEERSAESARSLRIDLLRGYCVFAMVVDHVGGPSILYLLTGGNRFYTSAAEGFIFISLVGLPWSILKSADGRACAEQRRE